MVSGERVSPEPRSPLIRSLSAGPSVQSPQLFTVYATGAGHGEVFEAGTAYIVATEQLFMRTTFRLVPLCSMSKRFK